MWESIMNFYDYHSEMVINVSYRVLLALVVLSVSALTARLLCRAIDRANNSFEHIDATLVPMIKTTLTLIVYLVGGVVILDIFGVNTSSIITLLGAAGLAIGLAIKDTLSNIAAGIMLLLLRPFRVGHYIECGTVAGTVEAVTLFATKLETGDGLSISAPNNILWGAPIKNFTVNGKRRMDITVSVSYSDSLEKVFAVLADLVKKEKRFLSEPAAQIIMVSILPSAIKVQLRAWTTVDDYWDTYWEMNRKVKEEIESAGIQIPFPQMDVHVKEKIKAEGE